MTSVWVAEAISALLISVNAGASPLGAGYSLLNSRYLRIRVARQDVDALRPCARFATCADLLGLLANRCLLLGRETCFRLRTCMTLRGFFVSAVSWRSSKSQYNVVKGQAFARLLCGGFVNVHLFKTAPVVSDLSPKGIGHITNRAASICFTSWAAP